jgi:hypothetical protein
VGGGPVAGVGAGAQHRDGLLDAALLGQQIAQPVGGGPVAGVGAGAQHRDGLLDAALLGQQIAQPVGGELVAGIGADPQLLEARSGRQQATLSGSRIPTEVRLLRVRPVWKTLVPQPEPFRPRLVDVLGPGERRQPKMLHRRTPPARMVVLIAGALERRHHLLRARARIDVQRDAARPVQLELVPHLHRRNRGPYRLGYLIERRSDPDPERAGPSCTGRRPRRATASPRTTSACPGPTPKPPSPG